MENSDNNCSVNKQTSTAHDRTDAVNKKTNLTKNINEKNINKSQHSKLSFLSFGKKIYERSTSKKNNNNGDFSKLSTEQVDRKIDVSASLSTPPSPKIYVKKSSIGRAISSSTTIPKKIVSEKKKIFCDERKFQTYAGRQKPEQLRLERFTSFLSEDGGNNSNNGDNSAAVSVAKSQRHHFGSCDELDNALSLKKHEGSLGSKTVVSLSRNLGKIFWKRSNSVNISAPDPEFKVSYLGNVLASWAKGENCVEKQLATLWRNYTQNQKPDVMMRIKVCASGLQATTQQHGLTEYWANRITHCCAPKNYSRVFCWVYRHEGRKLKHELRCHAVLCSKERMVHEMCFTLKENLESALREFKREKLLKQNARLSLANAAYDNPSLPRRKILLSVGCNNYRPPLERSKSAPKLMAIEEIIGEGDEDEIEDTNEPEMKPCCQKDSLYPAMTLGRRRCRRGHSIRRTGKTRIHMFDVLQDEKLHNESLPSNVFSAEATTLVNDESIKLQPILPKDQTSEDFDDFEKLLQYSHYDANASLANEMQPYLDMHLPKIEARTISESRYEKDPLNPVIIVNPHPNADTITDNDSTTASFENDLATITLNETGNGDMRDFIVPKDEYTDIIMNLLEHESTHKQSIFEQNCGESIPSSIIICHQPLSSYSSNASSVEPMIGSANNADDESNAHAARKLISHDSDEGSISSGCETASIITTNLDDTSLKFVHGKQQSAHELSEVQTQHSTDSVRPMLDNSSSFALQTTYQRFNACQKNYEPPNEPNLESFDARTSNFLNMFLNNSEHTGIVNRHLQYHIAGNKIVHNSDSECSDESGYGELLERDRIKNKKRTTNCTLEKSQAQAAAKLLPR